MVYTQHTGSNQITFTIIYVARGSNEQDAKLNEVKLSIPSGTVISTKTKSYPSGKSHACRPDVTYYSHPCTVQDA